MVLDFRLLSKNGDFLSILYRMKKQGGNVKVYLPPSVDKMYQGILDIVHDHTQLEIDKQDTVVIADMVGAGEACDILKDKGVYVIGGGRLNDKLELDRDFGEAFMRKHGIDTPPTEVFTDFEGAKKLIESTGKRYVFKPNGNLETDLTYVSTSAENMLGMMDYLESKCPNNVEFELQEFHDGIEMSTEAWFNGNNFLQPINSTMEEKRFMPGDIGPNTGCMGNVVWVWDEEISQFLYEYLFEPMEETLREARYMGPLDINAIWTPDGPFGLEFTARFGYDAIQAYSRLINIPLTDFFEGFRYMSKMPVDADRQALAIRLSLPPFPNEGEVPEVPIMNYRSHMDNVYLSDVYLDKEEGLLKCAGEDGYVMCVAVDGKSLSTLQRKAYSIIEEIEIPGKQYRNDIGDRVAADRKEVTRYIKSLIHREKNS